jgi:hypothetical protein
LPNPPKQAKLKPEVSLTLDKSRGRRQCDMLIVCAFQFSPEVDESRLIFGRLKVLKARMN